MIRTPPRVVRSVKADPLVTRTELLTLIEKESSKYEVLLFFAGEKVAGKKNKEATIHSSVLVEGTRGATTRAILKILEKDNLIAGLVFEALYARAILDAEKEDKKRKKN
jgi:hypothetical protein